MNIKKARSSLTSELERSPCTAILLRVFTLWAFSCGFMLAAGQSNVLPSSTGNKSAFAVSATQVSFVISTSSSQTALASFASEDVNRTNSSSLHSLHNKTGVLTILQSSNFPVVGSTEPITLAISFITTSTAAPSVPRSVCSLLDASSFSITGFTEPVGLALFTSESLSNQSVASLSSSSSVLRPSSSVLSSLHGTNASISLQAIATISENTTPKPSSAKTIFSNSVKFQNSSASVLQDSSSRDQRLASAQGLHSSLQPLSSEVNEKLSTMHPLISGTYSYSQSSTNIGIHSPAHTFSHNSSTVSKRTVSVPSSTLAVSYQVSSEVTRTSPTFFETSLARSDATTTLAPSLSGAVLANSSMFKVSNTIIIQESATVPQTFVGSRPSHSSTSLESLSPFSGVSSTRTLEQIPFSVPPQNQTLSHSSVSSQTTMESSSVRFRGTSSDSQKQETTTAQTTLSSTETVIVMNNNSFIRSLSTSLSSLSSLYVSTGLLPNNSGPATEALPTSPITSREGFTATGSKIFISTSSPAGTSTASLAFHFHNSSSIVTQATITETKVTSNQSAYLSPSSTGPFLSDTTLPLNSTTLHYFASTPNVTKTLHNVSPESTIYVGPTNQVPATACTIGSSNSSFINNLKPTLSASESATETSHIMFSLSIISSLSSVNIKGNITSYQSVPRLSENFSASLLYQISITQDLTISTSSVISLATILTDQSGSDRSTDFPASLFNSGTVPTVSSMALLSSYVSHVASYTTQGVNETSVVSTPLSQVESVSYSPSFNKSESRVSASKQKSSMLPSLTASIVRTSSSGTGIPSYIQPSSTGSAGSSSAFPLDYSSSYSLQPNVTASDVKLAKAKSLTVSQTSQTSYVLPSLTLSIVSMTTSTHSLTSLLVSNYVSRTSLIPVESTVAMNSSIVLKTESSFRSLSISSGSAQLHAYSRKRFTSTMESLAVHERSSHLHDLSSSIFASGTEPSPQTLNITTTLPSVSISATPSVQQHSSSYNVPISIKSYSLLRSPGFTATVVTKNVSATPSLHSRLSSSDLVAHSSLVPLSTSLGLTAPSLQVSTTALSSVATSSFKVLSSSARELLQFGNTTSSSISESSASSEVSVVTSRFATVSPSLGTTFPSTNTPASASLQILVTSGETMVTSSYAVSLRPSSPVSAITSSVIVNPGIFVRFGISDVALNQRLDDASFKNNLTDGILLAYRNGSSDASSGNLSVQFISIDRTPDSNSTNVTITFEVLNGSEPLAAYQVIQSIERASFSLGQAVGYMVVDQPTIVFLPSSSVYTTTMTLSNSSPKKDIDMSSINEATSLMFHVNSTQQARASSTAGSPLTPVVESSVQSQQFLTAFSSLNITTIYSFQGHPSSFFREVTKTYSMLSITRTQTTSEFVITGSVTSVSPATSISTKRHSTDTSVIIALTSTNQSQVSLVTDHPQLTRSSEVSPRRMLTTVIPYVSALTISSRPSSVAVVTSRSVSITLSLSPTFSSVNTSSTASSQTYTTTGVPVITASYIVSLSSVRPSTSGLVVTSSAVVIPLGFFVRFGINVTMNRNVSDSSLKQQLREGILAAYKNGSADGMPGNTSVKIIGIERSPDSNSTNVTVTFQVLNGSEPLLAYLIIQSINQANYTLAQAVGYEVIQSPIIVYFSSMFSSMIPMSSAVSVSSFQTRKVSRTSFMPEVRQLSTEASFLFSVARTVSSESIGPKSSSVTSPETSSFPQLISSSFATSLTIDPQSFPSSRLFSTRSRLSTNTTSSDASSHFVSATESGSLLSSASSNERLTPTLAMSVNSSTSHKILVTVSLSIVKVVNSSERQPPTTQTVSMTREVSESSQTVWHLSSSSTSLSRSSGVTLRSQAASILPSQLSLLLSTSYTVLGQSPTSIATSPFLKLSSAVTMVNVTETQSIPPRASSVTLKLPSLTSSLVGIAPTIITPTKRSPSAMVSASSNYFNLTVASIAPLVPSILSSISTTAHLELSESLELNSSLITKSSITENASSLIPTVSKFTNSSSPAVSHYQSTSRLKTSLLLITTTTQSYMQKGSTIPSGSRKSIELNSTSLATSLHVANKSSFLSSYASVTHTSSIRRNLSSLSASYSLVGNGSSSTTSPLDRTRFSDVTTLKVPHTVSLTGSRTTKLNITTSGVQVSSLPAANVSSTLGVSFSPVKTATVPPMTIRVASSSQLGTSGLIAPATEVSFPNPSVQPNTSSASISLITSFTSTESVSSRVSMLSLLQTLSSTYPLHSASPASISRSSPSTIQPPSTTTQLTTSDISSQPLQSLAFPKKTSVLSFSVSKFATHFSLETTGSSLLSSTRSVTFSASFKATAIDSPSTPITSMTSQVTTLSVKPSSDMSLATAASDNRSITTSTRSLLASSQGLSQTTRRLSSIRTVELLSSRRLIAETAVKSHIVEASSSGSLITGLTYSLIHFRSSVVLAFSEAVAPSSAKAFEAIVSSVGTRELSSAGSTVPVDSICLTSSSTGSVEPEISSVVLTKSILSTLPLSSKTVVKGESSSSFERRSVYSSLKTSTELTFTSLFPPVTSLHPLSSSLVRVTSSFFPFLSPSSALAVTSGEPAETTRISEKSMIVSGTVLSETSATKPFASTMPLLTVSLLLTSAHDATTKQTPESASSVSKTSSAAATPVEPTEPIRPTTNPNNTEGLVGIQILVPTTDNETTSAFREGIELKLAAAYRWGDEKRRTRAKRDLTVPTTFNAKNLKFWKQSATFKVHEKRASRYRRQVDGIVALAETIRRAKPIVGEEIVDIEYRIFDSITMLSAEHIVETTNRLSEAELVSVIKYAVTLRPYIVKDIQVEPTPVARSKWETLLPAIIVPVAVVVFLCLAFTFARCAAKRKRKQQNVKPDKEHPYESLEERVVHPYDGIPPKNKHGPSKKKRSSISSTSSNEVPPKYPTLPIPDYSPGPSDIPGKPSQQYRRRTDGRDGDQKHNNDHPTKGGNTANGHIQRERPIKKSRDVRDSIEMEQLAGVVENRPQMRDEKLASSLKRQDPPIKFMSLPPPVQTPLVGPKPSIPHTSTEEKKEHDRIISESGVPQANVERWRNKMRHREKMRQDMREKEREKERKLKKLEKEGKSEKEKDIEEDQASTVLRSLTAERKRRSRLDRWRKNRVGTSSSKSSSGTSSSSSSSSESDSETEKKHNKGKNKKDKNKRAKVPPLATGQAAKATARDTMRETVWTIKETPGVRLVSVRPISEAQQGQREPSPQPVYLQNGVQGQTPPPTRQGDRVHYLLETGYPVLPEFPSTLVRPPETQELNDDVAYEEGLDPYTVQYDEQGYYPKDAFIRSGVPAEPRRVFGGPPFHEDEHIYEEPMITPASLPQTHVVSPQENQARLLIPTPYARSYLGRAPVTKGRPTSASQHPGVARQTRARPTSALTEPMARYTPPPGRPTPSNRSLAPSVPGSRYMLANRPTVATAPEPSIGSSPRYMVNPERQKEQLPSPFDGARAILSRAQANVNRFEKDSRTNVPNEADAAPAPERLYAKPQRKTPPRAHAAPKEPAPTGTSRLDVAAREHAELEAQLLVSRALARARNNEMLTAIHSQRAHTMNVVQYVKKNSVRLQHSVKRITNETKKKTKTKKKKESSSSSNSSSSSSSSSSGESEKKVKKPEKKMKSKSREKKAVVRPLPATPSQSWT